MYFLLAGLHERFHLLSYGLAIILLVIGAKMLLMDIFHVSVVWSLVLTMSILLGSIALSLVIKPTGITGSAYPFKPKEDEGQTH